MLFFKKSLGEAKLSAISVYIVLYFMPTVKFELQHCLIPRVGNLRPACDWEEVKPVVVFCDEKSRNQGQILSDNL